MSKIKLKNISKLINSGLTPLRSNPSFWDTGNIPWLKTEQLGVKYIYDTNEKITKEAINKTSIKINPANTISIAMYGEGRTRGNVSILKKEMTTNQACCNIVLDEEKANHEYIYYFLKTKYEKLRSLSSGVRKNLNSDDIKNFEVVLPEKLEDQQKIASVLSTLDAKIELNNKINIELEAMAKTLYDYWFVQFDFPNENGKPYKSNGGEMVWSEELKREIPKGWDVRRLKELLKKNNKKFNLNDEKHNIDTIDLSVMPSSTMCLTEKNTSDEFGTNLFEMNKFDILFGGIRPYLLKAGFAPFDGLVTGTVHSFNVINQHNYNFALLTMIHESMFQFAISNSKGTKMPVVGADDLLEYRLPYKEEVVKKFNQILSFKEIISKNIQENQTLASLRDFLLPMLMNGQVVVE